MQVGPLRGTNVRSSWHPLSVHETYVVATTNFLASGQAGYGEFAKVGNYVDTRVNLPEAFIYFATHEATLVDVQKSEYSTQSFIMARDNY